MVGSEHDAKVRDDDVEARVLVREVLDVTEIEGDLGSFLFRALASLRKHRLGDIDPGDDTAGACRPHRNLAGAGREVEHALACGDLKEANELVLDRGQTRGKALVRSLPPDLARLAHRTKSILSA